MFRRRGYRMIQPRFQLRGAGLVTGTPVGTHVSPASDRLHFQAGKRPQIFRIDVGDGPEFESVSNPMRNIVSVLGEAFYRRAAAGFSRPDEYIDNVSIALVDHRCYFPAIEIVQPTSNQGESVLGEIVNGWGEFELSVEPGFDGVLIGRRDIEQVRGQQGANVTGDHVLSKRLAARAIGHATLIQENQADHRHDCRRQGQWNREPWKNKSALGPLLYTRIRQAEEQIGSSREAFPEPQIELVDY